MNQELKPNTVNKNLFTISSIEDKLMSAMLCGRSEVSHGRTVEMVLPVMFSILMGAEQVVGFGRLSRAEQ